MKRKSTAAEATPYTYAQTPTTSGIVQRRGDLHRHYGFQGVFAFIVSGPARTRPLHKDPSSLLAPPSSIGPSLQDTVMAEPAVGGGILPYQSALQSARGDAPKICCNCCNMPRHRTIAPAVQCWVIDVMGTKVLRNEIQGHQDSVLFLKFI